MSVEQHVTISCDNFTCEATIDNDRSLLDARTEATAAGWANTIHYLGVARRMILQDFCSEHREQGFDGATMRAQLAAESQVVPASRTDVEDER
jgi:hypothetical protein